VNLTVTATRVLLEVERGAVPLPQALERHRRGLNSAREHALLQEICYGVLRWQPRLEALLHALLTRPAKQLDRVVLWLLLTGLYRLGHLQAPASLSVDLTVRACTPLRRAWSHGLVNAVLRGYQRDRERLEHRATTAEPARYAHPGWLIEAFRRAWPEHWQDVLAAGNQRPPMCLRVNRRRGGRNAYLQQLQQHGVAATATIHGPCGVVLAQPLPTARLTGFAEGLVSVQDEAAQLAADLLEPPVGARVLDACAAPGGKTTHLLEYQPEVAEVVALDLHAERLALLHANLQRLGLTARVLQADACDPGAWWDGRPFDRVLLDAPCSATGVIRRHPDIKVLRTPDDVAALTARQDALLRALWPTLAAGGYLLYATCSVLPRENDARVAALLATREDATVVPITAGWGHATTHGRQILPGEAGMDGFYYAKLQKRA